MYKFCKCHFCHDIDSEFCWFGKFWCSKSAKIHESQNSEPINVFKWQIFRPYIQQLWFHASCDISNSDVVFSHANLSNLLGPIGPNQIFVKKRLGLTGDRTRASRVKVGHANHYTSSTYWLKNSQIYYTFAKFCMFLQTIPKFAKAIASIPQQLLIDVSDT